MHRRAAKDGMKAAKKQKRLKRIIVGLTLGVTVFAVVFLGMQGATISQSVEEGKIT